MSNEEKSKKGYQWRFFRSGGFDQVRIETADDRPDPSDRLWQLQAGRRLAVALAGLSAQERWLLGLAYFRDASHAAIAETTGLPLGTVKSSILRAQAKLRLQLQPVT